MKGKRNQYTDSFKAKVALAALKGDRTINELVSQFGIHQTLIHAWKKQLLNGAPDLFAKPAKGIDQTETLQAELYEQIGRLKMELEWLKKKTAPFG
jgi:putative transposase